MAVAAAQQTQKGHSTTVELEETGLMPLTAGISFTIKTKLGQRTSEASTSLQTRPKGCEQMVFVRALGLKNTNKTTQNQCSATGIFLVFEHKGIVSAGHSSLSCVSGFCSLAEQGR